MTAALPYVYAPRHFGHLAGVYLPADIYSRYNRLRGRDVLFVCGTDENAPTTILEARRRSITPQQLSDRYHPFQLGVFERLGVSFDIFSRTSRRIHHETVWEFYRELDRRGLIYSDEIRQPFCESCGEYLPDRFVRGRCPRCGADDQYGDCCEVCARWFDPSELIDPSCTICGARPVLRSVRHSFLRLSALTGPVLEYVEEVGRAWRPRTYHKTVSWLRDEGLLDKDITRDYEWGPPAPFLEPGQVVYNWVENLLGYISATRDWASGSSKWEEYWKDDSRIICFLGKDNLFFHTILFPALLLGHGGYSLPAQVVVNEHVKLGEAKMSTSRGNAAWLHDLLERFEPEVLRYYAAAIAPENRDTSFSEEELVSRANSDLADNLGNLVNRVLVLFDRVIGNDGFPDPIQLGDRHRRLLAGVEKLTGEVEEGLEGFEFKRALETIMQLAREGNKFLSEARPWENQGTAPATIWVLLVLLRNISVLLCPFLPESADRIWSRLGYQVDIQRLGWEAALRLEPAIPTGDRTILFPKIG